MWPCGPARPSGTAAISIWAPGITAALVTRWPAPQRTPTGPRAACPRHDPCLGRSGSASHRLAARARCLRGSPRRARPAATWPGRLRHGPRHQPSPRPVHQAPRRRSRHRARKGRHLGRLRSQARHPDPDLAGPQRQLDCGVMNANGSRPVAARVGVAAALPSLPWIATGLLVRRGPSPGRRHCPHRRSRPPRRQDAAHMADQPRLRMSLMASEPDRPHDGPLHPSMPNRSPASS